MSYKVLISQGQGRLHFSETCVSLRNVNVDFETLTGWVPKSNNSKLIDLFGNFLGKSKLSVRLSMRQPKGLEKDRVISCAKAEVFHYGLVYLAKLGFISMDKALSVGWTYWGLNSKRFIKGDVSIFHVRSGAGQGGAISYAKENGIKVITDHSIAHPMAMKSFLLEIYQKFGIPFDLDPNSKFWQMVLMDCEQSDFLLVNSQFVAETFIDQNFPIHKIKIIYLGVREDFLYLKRCWLNSKCTRLLFTGSFSIRKGCTIIIEALDILRKEGIDVVLDVLGNYDELPFIRKVYDIPSNIIFHGNVIQDDLKQFLIDSDIYIFPTLAEGSARSAMEAMAAGLPVITTNNCGSPIQNNISGMIIPINDPVALAGQIKILALDSKLRERIGKTASKLIDENYRWSDYGRNLKQFYTEIMI